MSEKKVDRSKGEVELDSSGEVVFKPAKPEGTSHRYSNQPYMDLGYKQALEDLGLHKPGTIKEVADLYDKAAKECESPKGTWLVRVYKNWGAVGQKEVARITVDENSGMSSGAILNNPRNEIPAKYNIYDIIQEMQRIDQKVESQS